MLLFLELLLLCNSQIENILGVLFLLDFILKSSKNKTSQYLLILIMIQIKLICRYCQKYKFAYTQIYKSIHYIVILGTQKCFP